MMNFKLYKNDRAYTSMLLNESWKVVEDNTEWARFERRPESVFYAGKRDAK